MGLYPTKTRRLALRGRGDELFGPMAKLLIKDGRKRNAEGRKKLGAEEGGIRQGAC